jgi:hypothetical protein
MKSVFARLRQHMPTLLGAALLILVADGFILIFRLAGLPRSIAVYAGMLAFTVSGSLLSRHIFKSSALNEAGEDYHA